MNCQRNETNKPAKTMREELEERANTVAWPSYLLTWRSEAAGVFPASVHVGALIFDLRTETSECVCYLIV